MKTPLLNALLLLVLVTPILGLAEESAPAAAKPADPQLVSGSSAPEFKPVSWIQGEPVTAFEKDKTYLLECWATWCGPCLEAIPHVNELHHKFKDKGLVVIGVNVWEEPEGKVSQFVKQKGDGMAYRIAYGGTLTSAFSEKWLRPAHVQGIPHTFVVRDGAILWQGHPDDLTEAVITSMLEGKFKAGDPVARIGTGKRCTTACELEDAIREQIRAGKLEEAERMVAELEVLRPPTYWSQWEFKADIAIARGKPEEAVASLKQLILPRGSQKYLEDFKALMFSDLMVSKKGLGAARDYQVALDCARRVAAAEEFADSKPLLGIIEARALYGLGRKDESLKALEAVDATKVDPTISEEYAQILRDLKAGKEWPKGHFNPGAE